MKRVLMILFVGLIVMMYVPMKVFGEAKGSAVSTVQMAAPVDLVADESLFGEEGLSVLVEGVFERLVGGFETEMANPIYVTLFASQEFTMTEGQDYAICLGNKDGELPLGIRSWRLVPWQEVNALQLELQVSEPGSYWVDRIRIGREWFAIGELNIEVKAGYPTSSLLSCESALRLGWFMVHEVAGAANISALKIRLTYALPVMSDTQITRFWGILPNFAHEVLFTRIRVLDADGVLAYEVQYEGLMSEFDLAVKKGQQVLVEYGMNDFAPHYLLQAMVVYEENQMGNLGIFSF